MHRKEVTSGSYGKKSRRRAWLTIWDKLKSQCYNHRLMHRKRVTCELHDSYSRLMTIKHAIPKILSGRLNYYITRWRQEVSEFGDPLVTRCSRESPHPAEWAPGPPVELHRRTRKTQRWWPFEWGSICCSSVRSPTPSHSKTLSNPFRTLSIKWEIYIFLKDCLVMITYVYVFMDASVLYEYTTKPFNADRHFGGALNTSTVTLQKSKTPLSRMRCPE